MQEKREKNTDFVERLTDIIEFFNITTNSFANKLGYKRSQSLYDILNRKSKPSFDFFYKFLVSEFSETISVEWLIAGIGSMKKNKQPKLPGAVTAIEHNALLMIRELSGENALLKKEIEDLRKKNGPRNYSLVAEE